MKATMKRAVITAVASVSIAFTTAASARADEFINVLTGGPSGVYYPLGCWFPRGTEPVLE